MTASSALDHMTSQLPFTMPVTQITGQNSLEFIRAVFDHYENGRVFAITKPGVPLPFPNDDGDVLDLPAASATNGWGRLKHQQNTADTPHRSP